MKKAFFLGFVVIASQAFGVERYAFSGFNASGFSCAESNQSAIAACNQAISEFSATHTVIGPVGCPYQYCACSGGNIPNSACLGYARWEDHKPCAAPEQIQFVSSNASGFGCYDAVEKAMGDLYAQAAQFSNARPVTFLHFDPCNCSGGNIAQATCSAQVRFLNCPN